MRFLQKDKANKLIIVISDIHLGAGAIIDGKRNVLEDFNYDEELVEFVDYFSKGEMDNKEVELIINGDLFDLLAVPHVKYFDDEFWSEDAALDKLKIILEAHPQVMESFVRFCSSKNNKITYIVGNHDAEVILPKVSNYLIEQFPEPSRERFNLIIDSHKNYVPEEGIFIKHGHEYEMAHDFDPDTAIIEDDKGNKYFNPPWGSYYVTRVINKFKEDREHVNAVRPIQNFLIHGLIYDTMFIIRFIVANAYYFIMVRFIFFFKQSKNIKEIVSFVTNELELFNDYETLTKTFFEETPDAKVLIVGHTHEPIIRTFQNGTTFINTGTWTNMYHLDFKKRGTGKNLSFAKISFEKNKSEKKLLEISLNSWKGKNDFPYLEL